MVSDMDGAAVIDPESIVSDSTRAGNHRISSPRPRSCAGYGAAAHPSRPRVPGDSVHGSGFQIKPAQINFKYQLQGQESQWVDAGSRRTAYYSHLPAGNYTFRVIAGSSDGIWNLKGATLAVVVLAPFYETWWFASLLLVLAAAGTALGWNYRVAQLKLASAAQQAFSQQLIASQENERRRIAAELHDSLGQRLVVINNLALICIFVSR